MPLHTGKSQKAFSENVRTEMHAGKPQKQALAIAYAMQRRTKKADGGEMRYAEGGCVECAKGACMAHGDIVERAMRRRMSEGGMVSNDDEKKNVEFEKDEFDDLEKDDHLEPHEMGSEEHGEDEMLYDDERDIVKRAMRARKDKMPHPA